MLRKPRLKSFLTVYPLSETVWGLRGGAEEMWRVRLDTEERLRGFCSLLPHLNGTKTRGEVLSAATNGTATAAVESVLSTLENAGLLEEADLHGLAPEDAQRFSQQISFFSRFTAEGGAKYQALLQEAVIAVSGSGELTESIATQLRGSGVLNVPVIRRDELRKTYEQPQYPTTTDFGVAALDSNKKISLVIYGEEEHSPAELEAIDTISRRRQIPWLLVRATDVHEGSVGPLFVPGETASYVSFEARLRSNMDHYADYEAFDRHVRTRPDTAAPAGGLRATLTCLASIAVIEAVKLVTGVMPASLAGKFLTVNFVTWDTEVHEVLRMPRLEMDADAVQAYPWKVAPYAANESRRG